MRTPGLRLRQVFEHSTHFKVQKPGGDTITIAKKGLSPSTVGRLRRFAQGGEVRNYARDGEVTEESEPLAKMPEIAPEASSAAPATEEVVVPAVPSDAPGIVAAQAGRKRGPVKAADAAAAPSDVQMRQTLTEDKARFSAPPPVAPVAAPAPVQVIVQAPSQPAATVAPAPVAQPQPMTAAPATEKAVQPLVPEMPQPAPRSPPSPKPVTQKTQPLEAALPSFTALSPEDVAFLADKSDAYIGGYSSIINRGGSRDDAMAQGEFADDEATPVAAIAPAISAAPVPSVVAAARPAVSALSAAPIAPAAPVAPAAAAPAPVAEPVAAGRPAAPVPAPTSAVLQPPDVLTDNQIEELVSAAPAAYRPAMRTTLVSQRDQQLIERQQAEQQAASMTASEKRLSDELAKVGADIAAARQKRTDIQNEIQAARDEGKSFSPMEILGKIGTVLAMSVAGFASGYTGMPNYAMQAFNQALDRDLERQRRKTDSLLNELKTVTATQEDAEQFYRGIAKEAVSLEAKRAELQATTQKSRAAYGAVAGKFALEAYKDFAEIESKTASAQASRARAAGELTAAERMAIETAKAAERKQKIALEEKSLREQVKARALREREHELAVKDKDEKWRFDRTFYATNAEDIPLMSSTPAEGRKAEAEILGQTDALHAARRALKVLKENPVEAYVPKTEANQQAQLALSQFLERYPKSERFGRPLNVTASKVIKSGIPSLGVSGILDKTFGDPLAVMRELIRDAEQSRADAIKTYGARTPEAAKQAIEAIKKHDESIWGPDIDFQATGGQ